MSRTAEIVCDTEPPADWMNLDWMKVPVVQKKVGHVLTCVPRGLYNQPFGSDQELLAGWGVHSAQGPSAMCHPLYLVLNWVWIAIAEGPGGWGTGHPPGTVGLHVCLLFYIINK